MTKAKHPEYPFSIRPLMPEEGGGFLLEFPDLPGCIADGATPEEAIEEGRKALRSWLNTAKKHGDPIPKPSIVRASQVFNGKVLQRFPKTLHARLAARAKQEGVSLNQLILALVAEGIGYRTRASQ